MLNLVFGAGGGACTVPPPPVTNLRIELRASRQLKSHFMMTNQLVISTKNLPCATTQQSIFTNMSGVSINEL